MHICGKNVLVLHFYKMQQLSFGCLQPSRTNPIAHLFYLFCLSFSVTFPYFSAMCVSASTFSSCFVFFERNINIRYL